MQCFENFGGGEFPPVVARLPPFLDVLVERLGSEFSTSVFLQDTYLHWPVSTLEFL